MGLTTKQIIALLQLDGCGRITTSKVMTYAQENKKEIKAPDDLSVFLHFCKKNQIASRLKEYSIDELEVALDKAESIIQKSRSNQIGIVSYYDSSFPDRLKNLRDEKGAFTSPVILYYLGDIEVANLPAIAIIGTREPTNQGIQAGEYFGRIFAENKFNIVSGLAIGCDTAGHTGALSANGVTTAFLAHGLDTVYPPQNKQLAEKIVANGGLLLSEYPIGDFLTRNKLVERDRLQAGLSQATIVVQTGIKGGTMHAANATLASKKPLYVVEYKSSEVMRNEKVQGNAFLVSKGAKYISSENVNEVIQSMTHKNNVVKKNLTLFD